MDGKGDEIACSGCGTKIYRREGKLFVLRAERSQSPFSVSAPQLWARIREDGPWRTEAPADEPLRRGVAVVSFQKSLKPIRLNGRIRGFSEQLGGALPAGVFLYDDLLVLWFQDERETIHCPLVQLRAIQTASSSLQITTPKEGLLDLRFPMDSSRRWEDLLRTAVDHAHQKAGNGSVLEFQPVVLTASRQAARLKGGREAKLRRYGVPLDRKTIIKSAGVYRCTRVLSKVVVRLLQHVEVSGLERVPNVGPFILVANHQSFFDPIILHAILPRVVHTLTKSTQFTQSAIMRWWLPRLKAIPTRRYQVDPQAVRTVLRVLAWGEGVCIYPEGERSWDGSVQSLRFGTLRLLLRAGVPVVPCVIDGTWGAWPRWSRKIVHHPISVRFGKPLRIGRHDGRVAAERSLFALHQLVAQSISPNPPEGWDSESSP